MAKKATAPKKPVNTVEKNDNVSYTPKKAEKKTTMRFFGIDIQRYDY